MSATAAATLGVTVVVAVAGYFATYALNLRLQRRKDRLERVDQQLRELYGPLYALLRAADVAWRAFRSRVRPEGPFWDPNSPPSEDEVAAWRLWMSTVFAPLNQRMADAVTAHADLLREDQMPPCLVALCAHVSGYAPVLARWSSGAIDSDPRSNVSVINFPRAALEEYVEQSFLALKREQAELLRAAGPGRKSGPPAAPD